MKKPVSGSLYHRGWPHNTQSNLSSAHHHDKNIANHNKNRAIMNNSWSNKEEESVGGSISSVNTLTMDSSSMNCWGTKKRKGTMPLSWDDLVSCFEMRLGEILLCPNQSCNCILILHLIVLQWVIYKKILSNMNWYHVPFDGSCFVSDTDKSQSLNFAPTFFILLVCKLWWALESIEWR